MMMLLLLLLLHFYVNVLPYPRPPSTSVTPFLKCSGGTTRVLNRTAGDRKLQ